MNAFAHLDARNKMSTTGNRLRTIGSIAAILYFVVLAGLVLLAPIARLLPSLVWWRVLILIAPIALVVWLRSERHQQWQERRDFAKFERLRDRFDPYRADRDAAQQAELEAAKTEIEVLRGEVESLKTYLREASAAMDDMRGRLEVWEPPALIPWEPPPEEAARLRADGIVGIDWVRRGDHVANPAAGPEERIRFLLEQVERLRREPPTRKQGS